MHDAVVSLKIMIAARGYNRWRVSAHTALSNKDECHYELLADPTTRNF
jgi:hypothetical protein